MCLVFRRAAIVLFIVLALYNFVCESVPSDALEDIKAQIGVANSTQSKRMQQISGKGHLGKRTDGYRLTRKTSPWSSNRRRDAKNMHLQN